MKNIIVIDNFYKNPEAVRSFALHKACYVASNSLVNDFPGTESVQSFFSQALVQKMEKAIGSEISFDPAQFSFGVFAKTYALDNKKAVVHTDPTEWSAIVYLSSPEHCQGGTKFFDCLDVDPAIATPSCKVAMKFNRMVLFRSGSIPHVADGYFGTNDEDCRLLQLFFFNQKKEV